MTRSRRELESRDNEGFYSRESEMRSHEMRYCYNMNFSHALTMPPGAIRDGYSGYWATTNIRTEPVYEVEKLLAEGYEMVPADRCPGFGNDPLGRNPYHGKYVSTKDSILMEIPNEKLKARRDKFNHMNERRTRAIPGVKDTYGNIVLGARSAQNSMTNYDSF